MREHPFWTDDFDLDFPKIFPDARHLLGELGDVELVTVGTPDKNGRLNHPSVWNSDKTMLAFFGFNSAVRDARYCSPSSQDIRCTAWEVFRDAWPHHYLIVVERHPIWDTFALRGEFETILYDVRGYPAQGDVKQAKRRVMTSYSLAVREFGRLVNSHPTIVNALKTVDQPEASAS